MKWSDGLAHWRDEESRTAYLSVAFTWKIDEAKRVAEYYRLLGYTVKAGGPAMFRMDWAMKDFAEVDGVGSLPDAVMRHNPLATTASRGCPVGCWFCIVPAMEGREFTLLPEFTPRPILTDNNRFNGKSGCGSTKSPHRKTVRSGLKGADRDQR